MEYNFKEIEPKWQRRWQENKTYKVETDPSRPKFYVLDMFPYPSGAGLHVGHPLGYIASDIYSRYKRQKASTSCTRWDTTPSACPPSSTPYRPASTPP